MKSARTAPRTPPGRRKLGRILAVIVGALALAAAAWMGTVPSSQPAFWIGPATDSLPPSMRVEHLVESLAARFEQRNIAKEARGAPVRFGGIRPGHRLGLNSGYRAAIVAPPPSIISFRVRVPEAATLRFGAGVKEPGEGAEGAGSVRFAVSIDRRQVFARVIDTRDVAQRRWVDASVPLFDVAGRTVEIRMTAAALGPGPAAVPGWSHVRIVRDTSTQRQLAIASAPSVLFLLIDTLRADRLGCYGARPSPSPVLDKIADDGLVFEQAISQSSWTLPSVATLLTGLGPLSHGMRGGMVEKSAQARAAPVDPSYLSPAVTTIAERAQEAGITTFGASASPLVSRATSLARGFETFVEWGWDTEKKAWPRAESVNATFLDWLRDNSRYRFFAYLHYMDVHDPYDPPARYRPHAPGGLRTAIASGEISKVVRKIREGKRSPVTAAELDYLRALYDAQIKYWDDQLGILLRELDKSGVADSTILLITSDHGEEFEEHGRLKHAVHLYDELIHVPLIVSGPGISRGRVARQVQGIDVGPTVAELLEVRRPASLAGRGLLSERAAERPAFSETRWGIGSSGLRTTLVSLRTGAWKLIHAPAEGSFELYDLARDSAETVNRYGTEPQSSRLRDLLAQWWEQRPARPRGRERDPDLTGKLRRLGYLE